MNVFSVSWKDKGFKNLSLSRILNILEPLHEKYIWSVQWLEASGRIKSIIGLNMIDFEKACMIQPHGFILPISTLKSFIAACDDIVDIAISVNEAFDEIPKGARRPGWEKKCEVFIIFEDSSYWEIGAKNKDLFEKLKALRNSS